MIDAKSKSQCYNEYMINAFKTNYTLLIRLEKGLDYEDFNAEKQIGYKALKITENRWTCYIKMLADAGYIKGVKTMSFIDGTTDVDISEIGITLKGLQFLAENTMMVRICKTPKVLKDFEP